MNFFVPLLIGAEIKKSIIFINNKKKYYCDIIHLYKEINIINNNTNIESKNNKFNNQYYINNIDKNDKYINSKNFNSYLAGLFEGDGYISISRGNNLGKIQISKIRKVVIGITFNIKDLPLCQYLQDKLQKGWIRIKKNENACILFFHTDDGLITFVNIVNGHLRSPKLYKFNIVVDYLNLKYSLNITKYKEDNSELGSNNWLAGFIDADGGFYIRYTDKAKFRIACILTIEQRKIDPISNLSYEPLFLKISVFLNTKLEFSKHNNKSYFLIRASNRNNLKIILYYFSYYKLYSSKYLDFLNWSETAKLLLNNTAYNTFNKKHIYELKNSMNNKRTYFIWDHLLNL